MKTSNYIRSKLDRLPYGYIFTYEDFLDDVKNKEAIIKMLNRMVATGKIAKLCKGKYYKPENTVFGLLAPDLYQIVKDLLEVNGKVVGYITGYSIYNQLGLTTQVSNVIQIAKNETRPAFKRERYLISFIKQKNPIHKETIPLLQILDAIRYIKKIPDASVESACKRFLAILQGLTSKDQSTLVKLALKYPPATRALLGALLEVINHIELANYLRKTLNPITKYSLPGIEKITSNIEQWKF
jgi:hypothetical protein